VHIRSHRATAERAACTDVNLSNQ